MHIAAASENDSACAAFFSPSLLLRCLRAQPDSEATTRSEHRPVFIYVLLVYLFIFICLIR